MKNHYEPKLETPVGAVTPDVYEGAIGQLPPDNFVVSRTRDGSVASVFGQLRWDLTAYHPELQPTSLCFEYWDGGALTPSRLALTKESRYLLFALIWLRDGAPLSPGTLRNYLTVVNRLVEFAETSSIRLETVLGNAKLTQAFIESQKNGWLTETLGSLLQILAKEPLGLNVIPNSVIAKIKRIGREYRNSLNQHSPIPTRIYSSIISQLDRELSNWCGVADSALEVLLQCGKDPRMGRSIDQQCEIAKKLNIPHIYCPTFKQLASTEVLTYFDGLGRHANVKNLSAIICEVQATVKLTIQLFTGIRDDEAMSLPYHCLSTTVANGKTHYVVLGRTTKLNNGKIKRTRWVTNEEGYRAIKIAQQIADTIYAVFEVLPRKSPGRTNEHPLFVSVGYLALAGQSLTPNGEIFRAGDLALNRLKALRARLQPVIEDSDIRELEQIDPHRAWRSEPKFKVGQFWLLVSHQLRRSLALYAQRSGLVSLPSLRRQLQHITDEMSRYYARGSAFAKDIIGENKQHFGQEWQATQPESAALSYMLNVLLTDEVLIGGHANWIKHRLKGTDGIVLVDREVTMRRFRKGEIAFKETLIGGCTNVDKCDQVALNWLDVACLAGDCRNMVCNLTKLDRVIAAQKRMIGSLDRDSVEYRTENSDLAVLVAARERALQQREASK